MLNIVGICDTSFSSIDRTHLTLEASVVVKSLDISKNSTTFIFSPFYHINVKRVNRSH